MCWSCPRIRCSCCWCCPLINLWVTIFLLWLLLLIPAGCRARLGWCGPSIYRGCSLRWTPLINLLVYNCLFLLGFLIPTVCWLRRLCWNCPGVYWSCVWWWCSPLIRLLGITCLCLLFFLIPTGSLLTSLCWRGPKVCCNCGWRRSPLVSLLRIICLLLLGYFIPTGYWLRLLWGCRPWVWLQWLFWRCSPRIQLGSRFTLWHWVFSSPRWLLLNCRYLCPRVSILFFLIPFFLIPIFRLLFKSVKSFF